MWTGKAPYVVSREGVFSAHPDFPTFNEAHGLVPSPVYLDLMKRCAARL